MTNIVIISAMKEEKQEYIHLIENTTKVPHEFLDITQGKFKNKNIISIVSGIGKANAAATASFAINNFKPNLIINIGTCGGLASCNIGNVIVSSTCGYIDVDVTAFGYKKGQIPNEEEYFKTYSNIDLLLNKLQELNFIKTGLVCTADSFISDHNKLKDAISCYKNPICVEMEASSIAQICNHYKKPVIFVKKVSDLADKNAKNSFNENVSLVSENLLKVVSKLLTVV